MDADTEGRPMPKASVTDKLHATASTPLAKSTAEQSAPWLEPSYDDGSARMLKLHLDQVGDGASSPIPQIALHSVRFFAVVLLGVVGVAGMLGFVAWGMTIERKVPDAFGSTKNADERVEFFQTINGFVWAAVGLVLEEYYKIFLSVMMIYLANRKWYPNDVPERGMGSFKRGFVLIWFTPLVMYVINIALSSVFVEHKDEGVLRAFADGDLNAAQVLTARSQSLSAIAADSKANSVLDTVLRVAVRNQAVPFAIDPDSVCLVTSLKGINAATASKATGRHNETAEPDLIDLQSTSVSYGFPTRDWAVDAMPFALTPTHSVELDVTDKSAAAVADRDKRFAAFLQTSGVEFATISELLVQGITTHAKTESDSNGWVEYGCPEDQESETASGSGSESSGESSADGAAMDATAVRANTLAATRGRRQHTRAPSRQRPQHRARSQPRRLQDTDASGSASFAEDRASSKAGASSSGSFADVGASGEADASGVGSTADDLVSSEATSSDSSADEDFVFFKDARNEVEECFHGSSLYYMARVVPPNAKPQNFSSVVASFPERIGGSVDELKVKFETFEISPQLTLTAITLDLPYARDSWYLQPDMDVCGQDGKFLDEALQRETYKTDAEYDEAQKAQCDRSYFPYNYPRDDCGAQSCIFYDESDMLDVKKQMLLLPYQRQCNDSDARYDYDHNSWFPTNCIPEDDAVFLYGVGSYLVGNFEARGDDKGPVVTNPRRHKVYTYAKLQWRFDDLSKRFGATCNIAGGCDGLLHRLDSTQPTALPTSAKEKKTGRVLALGKNRLPTSFHKRTLKNPYPLLTLHARKDYNAFNTSYRMYEYLDLKLLNTTHKEEDGLKLSKGECSVVVDAYLKHIKNNHYYIQDPLQALYTSAFYYLFQDAAVKDVTLPPDNTLGVVDLSQPWIGSARMQGDREIKEIRYSISLVTAVATMLGIAILLIFMAIVLLWPRDAVKLTDETNLAAQYASVLTEDMYPARVHSRQLKFRGGRSVEMDEYTVDSITFRNLAAPDHTVVM